MFSTQFRSLIVFIITGWQFLPDEALRDSAFLNLRQITFLSIMATSIRVRKWKHWVNHSAVDLPGAKLPQLVVSYYVLIPQSGARKTAPFEFAKPPIGPKTCRDLSKVAADVNKPARPRAFKIGIEIGPRAFTRSYVIVLTASTNNSLCVNFSLARRRREYP